MDTQEMLHLLRAPGSRRLEAVDFALANPSLAVPPLFEELNRLKPIPFDAWSDGEIDFFFLALFVLAKLREPELFPLAIAFMSRADLPEMELIEDFVFERFPRILASVAGGRTAQLKEIVEAPVVDVYPRLAALDALIAMMFNGELTRPELMDYLRALFYEQPARESEPPPDGWTLWDGWLSAVRELHGQELLEEVRAGFAQNRFKLDIFDLEDTEARLMGAPVDQEGSVPSRFQLVTDVREELEYWFPEDEQEKAPWQWPFPKPYLSYAHDRLSRSGPSLELLKKEKKDKRKKAKAARRKNRK